jgi:hypothetical protein
LGSCRGSAGASTGLMETCGAGAGGAVSGLAGAEGATGTCMVGGGWGVAGWATGAAWGSAAPQALQKVSSGNTLVSHWGQAICGLVTKMPQCVQNRASDGSRVRQLEQITTNSLPHPMQKRAAAGFVVWQYGHNIFYPLLCEPTARRGRVEVLVQVNTAGGRVLAWFDSAPRLHRGVFFITAMIPQISPKEKPQLAPTKPPKILDAPPLVLNADVE